MLTHGGTQVQIEQTKAALEKIGVEVEYLRWWDENQPADVLHQFGWLPSALVTLAHGRGWKVANTILLSETCNRSARQLFPRKIGVRSILAAPLPSQVKTRLRWLAYHQCDRVMVGLNAERRVLEEVYGVRKGRVSLVPLGVAEEFLKAAPASRTEDHLITQGTIAPVKRSLELARLAIAAGTPILFVGKPFDPDNDYWREFSKVVDGKIVKYQPHVESAAEMIGLLRRSRGFVLMSRYENWSLAAHEAAACGLPLLLPDLPWSRERFADQASYFPKGGTESAVAALKNFHQRSPQLPAPQTRIHGWADTAEALKTIYTQLLAGGPGNR